ncbi:hypothetical protein [Noviherbaspirillum sp. ST9]|uniref:hypothetical protein n=1 Tax=Noviherbaspirillum sp. ST9 TaxID=3401606 RepID=UPI003B58A9FC
MTCPNCGEPAGVPLVWGDPDEATRAAVLRGEIVLAGCMIEPIGNAVPDCACLKCAYRWRDA